MVRPAFALDPRLFGRRFPGFILGGFEAADWAISEDLKLFDLKREYPVLHKHLQKLHADKGVIFAHSIEDGQPARGSGSLLGHVTLDDLQPRLAA